jgi:hypothetical protein
MRVPFMNSMMVIGFNAYNCKATRDIPMIYHSNAYGDQDQLFYFSIAGFNTTFLTNYQYNLCPPTKAAELRKDSINDCLEYIVRWKDFVVENRRKNKRQNEDKYFNPMENYLQQRAKALKYGRKIKYDQTKPRVHKDIRKGKESGLFIRNTFKNFKVKDTLWPKNVVFFD